MIIQGLQKLTLLDYPGKVACTVFTGGCNFRCPFCHNAPLVMDVEKNECMTEEELFFFLKKRRGILDAVCITGGEPLIQKDIDTFIRKIKNMGYKIKLDTNGSFPEKLQSLVEKELVDYVAMDVKNSKEKYGMTIGTGDCNISSVQKSIEFLLSGTVEYEFRTTVVKEFHQEEDIEKIAKWLKGAKRYFLQQFVDSGNVIKEGLHGYGKEKMEHMCNIAKKWVKETSVRGV